MILAFSGPSSSGKSTLLKEIKRRSFFPGKRIQFKKEDDFVTIQILKKILGKRLFTNYKKTKFFDRTPSKDISTFSLFVNLFYPLVVYIEFLLEYFYYEILFKDKILMRDRYIYDYLITFKDILQISNKPIEYMYKLFPKPSLLFFIRVDVNTIMKRNKNNVPNKITSKKSFQLKILNAYSKLASEKQILTINNNQSLAKSINDITFHIKAKNKLSRIKSLSISGLDGAGKSSLISMFCTYLEQLNISYKVVHFYHDNIPFKILKRAGFFRSENVIYPTKIVRRRKTLLWAILTWIDSYIQYSFATLFHHNKLIVFDRYFYDYIVTYKYHKIKGTAVFENIIPPLDYKLLLACDPAVAIKRKPENTVEFFVSSAKRFSALSKSYNMKVIDSTSTTKQTIFKKLITDIINK